MSHKATNWAVTQRGISPVAKVLLWQLADRHNPDNGCFPDIETLVRDSEMSRATVIRTLSDLQEKGLVVRVKRVHPVTKKQLPNRYILAFEDEFAAAGAVSDDEDQPEAESQIETRDEESRVSKSGIAESQKQAEPGVTGETPIEGLTSKLTSKGTGKRAMRADRASIFEVIWKVFPLRPGSPQMDAWHIFEKLEEADLGAIQKGAERFAQWFREEAARKGDDFEEALRFAPYLVNWLKGQKWHDAQNLPVTVKTNSEAAIVMEGTETVNKWTHSTLFEACERVRGKPCPVGKSGSWTFPKELVDEARRRLSSGNGPP